MKQYNNCKIVQDVLPNYIEKMTNDETNTFVEEHLTECKVCKEVYETMKRDIQLENKTEKNDKEVNYIKKFRKKINILKLIIVAILIIFIIGVGRKMIIISSLQNKVSKYTESTNYYSKLISRGGEQVTITECYVNGESYIFYLTNISEYGVRKLINYSDGTKVNTYFETNGDKIAVLDSNGLPAATMIPDYVYTGDNFGYLLSTSIFSSIKSKKINGQECYYIDKVFSPDVLIPAEGKSGVYIDKETGLAVRANNGTETNSDGKEFDIIVDYEYKFDVVTDEDIQEPDITEYRIQENN